MEWQDLQDRKDYIAKAVPEAKFSEFVDYGWTVSGSLSVLSGRGHEEPL